MFWFITFIRRHSVNITKILERDLNNDIFYADFCLECVWTETYKKDYPGYSASKVQELKLVYIFRCFFHNHFVGIRL